MDKVTVFVCVFEFILETLLLHERQRTNVVASLLTSDSIHELVIGSAAQFHNLQQLVDV